MLGANLLFVAALGFVDARQASVYPAIVTDQIRPRLDTSGGRLFFDGHWGVQYYATQIGGEPFDELHPPSLRVGDLVVVAKLAWPKLTHPPTETRIKALREFEAAISERGEQHSDRAA